LIEFNGGGILFAQNNKKAELMKRKQDKSTVTLGNEITHLIANEAPHITNIPSDLYPNIGHMLNRKAISSWMSTCNFFATSKAMCTVRDTKPADFIITSGYYNQTFISFNNGNIVKYRR
jgi:hypothetical protein